MTEWVCLSQVLATTDASLKVVAKEQQPLNPMLLVNYDLPTRKVWDSASLNKCDPIGSRLKI